MSKSSNNLSLLTFKTFKRLMHYKDLLTTLTVCYRLINTLKQRNIGTFKLLIHILKKFGDFKTFRVLNIKRQLRLKKHDKT